MYCQCEAGDVFHRSQLIHPVIVDSWSVYKGSSCVSIRSRIPGVDRMKKKIISVLFGFCRVTLMGCSVTILL